jgi:hypothetical protein
MMSKGRLETKVARISHDQSLEIGGTAVECLPGSESARQNGCLCPIIDNHDGKGYRGDSTVYGYVVNGECPLHGLGVADA